MGNCCNIPKLQQVLINVSSDEENYDSDEYDVDDILKADLEQDHYNELVYMASKFYHG